MTLLYVFVLVLCVSVASGDDHGIQTSTMLSTQSSSQSSSSQGPQSTASTQPSPQPQADVVDNCVENAKKSLYDNLGRSMPQYQNLTSNLTAPREFYTKLFNTNFTKDTYLSYCRSYANNRGELDKCSNTTNKTLAMIQFSFPDYMCVKRVNEYADAIACLQNVNNSAEAYNCRTGKCANNEQNSIWAKNPPANATREQLTQYAMGDCLYTRCMAECRKSAIEQKCGNDKGEMEMEALKVALSSAQSLSDSVSSLKMAVSNAMQNIFPTECRDAATMPLRIFAGAGSDYLSAALNGTFNMFQSIQNSTLFGMGGAGGAGAATTKRPGGGAESISKSGFGLSIVIALVFAKLIM